MTLSSIFSAVAAIIASWKAPTNVENDIADGVALLTAANNVDPQLAIGGIILRYIGTAGASYENLVNDQAALVATVPASFSGEPDSIVVLALRESSPLAKQLLGL